MTHLPNKMAAILLGAATTVGMAVAMRATASAATVRPAINQVNCTDGNFLQVFWHKEDQQVASQESCFANAGVAFFTDCNGKCWLDAFQTGNNVVQFAADGRFQPDTPVGRHTFFTFPNFPGGVDLQAMKIF